MFILFYSSFHFSKEIEHLKKLYDSNKIKSVQSIIDLCAKEEATFAFAHFSRSELEASSDNPRIFRIKGNTNGISGLLYEKMNPAIFISSYLAKSSPVFQMVEFDPLTLSFNWAEYNEQTQEFNIRPSECLSCHKGPPDQYGNPTFKLISIGAYPDWAGLYIPSHNGGLYGHPFGASKMRTTKYDVDLFEKLKKMSRKEKRFKGANISNTWSFLADSNMDFSDSIIEFNSAALGKKIYDRYRKGETTELSKKIIEKFLRREKILYEGWEFIPPISEESKKIIISNFMKSGEGKLKIFKKLDMIHGYSRKISLGYGVEAKNLTKNTDYIKVIEAEKPKFYFWFNVILTLLKELEIDPLEAFSGYGDDKFPLITGRSDWFRKFRFDLLRAKNKICEKSLRE